MNINRINASNISQIYKKNHTESKKVSSEKTTIKDGLELSESGKIFNMALKALQDQPEVREAKVNEIAEKIKTGQYKVGNEDLVNSIFKNAFYTK